MVAPIRHVGEYGDLADEEALELHRLASDGMDALARLYAPQGYNVGWNLGAAPGPAPSTMSTCTSCLAGAATRTSCRCLLT